MLKRAHETKEKEITKKLKKEQSMGKVKTDNKIIDNIGKLAEEAENLEDETDGIGDKIK